MKLFLLSLFVFIALFSSHAQQVFIDGKAGERLLTWEDFAGSPNESVQYKAYTFWAVNYTVSGIDFNGETALLKGLEVTLRFENDKSWVKLNTDYLLKHEQGHFDIGRLCQLELLININSTSFEKSNFKNQLKNIFKNTMTKYKDMGKKYDEETNHSINKEKQEEWNNFLQNEKERLLKLNNK